MSLNVLVVDDSAVMRAMIIRTLSRSQLPLRDVHEAAEGMEALQLLDAHWIDLALVDLNMPGMSGEALIEAIRENPGIADLAILVISGEDRETHLSWIREQRADFLQKPFTLDAFRAAVERLTGARPAEPIVTSVAETPAAT
jgi:two-component system chemotaxis response regulator CheY